MLTRSQEREQAFVLLFEKEFQPELSMEDILNLSLESDYIEDSAFTKTLALTAQEKQTEVDRKITEYAVGWTIDRMTKVSLAILRLAVAEMMFVDDVPVGVSINEAVELAKKYAGKEDSAFINGILGNISREQK